MSVCLPFFDYVFAVSLSLTPSEFIFAFVPSDQNALHFFTCTHSNVLATNERIQTNSNNISKNNQNTQFNSNVYVCVCTFPNGLWPFFCLYLSLFLSYSLVLFSSIIELYLHKIAISVIPRVNRANVEQIRARYSHAAVRSMAHLFLFGLEF